MSFSAARSHRIHTTRTPIVRLKHFWQTSKNFFLCPRFAEYWSVATRPATENGLGMTSPVAQDQLERLLLIFPLLPDSAKIFHLWKQLVIDHDVKGKNAHDARLIAAMKAHNLTHLLTFNISDFSRYSGIAIITPSQMRQA
jgi:hypothetical protein